MTEDALIFSIAELDREISAARAKAEAARSTLAKMQKLVKDQRSKALILGELLRLRKDNPVISLPEYRNMKREKAKADEDLKTMLGKLDEAERLMQGLVESIEHRLKFRDQQQHLLDNPPQVVLEFKRDPVR